MASERELDAQVAEKVMGLYRHHLTNLAWTTPPTGPRTLDELVDLPHYTTDAAVFMQVVKRMHEMHPGWYFSMYSKTYDSKSVHALGGSIR